MLMTTMQMRSQTPQECHSLWFPKPADGLIGGQTAQQVSPVARSATRGGVKPGVARVLMYQVFHTFIVELILIEDFFSFPSIHGVAHDHFLQASSCTNE